MKRDFDEILAEAKTEKTYQLPELSSDSLTAIWLKWLNVTSFIIDVFESILYTEQAKLEGVIALKRYGTVNWYITNTLAFQLGDTLVFDSATGLFGYPVIDETKQIVAKCSVTEQVDGSMLVKVAQSENGSLAPIIPSDLNQVFSYVNETKVGGTVIHLLSQPSDVISGDAQLFYDGNLSEAQIKELVQSAIIEYRDSFAFNGVLLKNHLIDVIREIEAVDDVYFTNLIGTSVDNTDTPIDRSYSTFSGYFNYSDNWVDSWVLTPRYAQ